MGRFADCRRSLRAGRAAAFGASLTLAALAVVPPASAGSAIPRGDGQYANYKQRPNRPLFPAGIYVVINVDPGGTAVWPEVSCTPHPAVSNSSTWLWGGPANPIALRHEAFSVKGWRRAGKSALGGPFTRRRLFVHITGRFIGGVFVGRAFIGGAGATCTQTSYRAFLVGQNHQGL